MFSKKKSEKLGIRINRKEPTPSTNTVTEEAAKSADKKEPTAPSTNTVPNEKSDKTATNTNPNITQGKIVSSPPYKIMSCDQVVEVIRLE